MIRLGQSLEARGATNVRTQTIRGIPWLTVCLFACAQVAAAEPVTLDAIGKKWQERQDEVKSAKFVWSEERTDTKGSLSSTQPRKEDNPIAQTTNSPTDVTYTTTVTASFQGDSLLYSYTHRHWSPKTNAMKELPRLCVFDGKISKTLYIAGGGLFTAYPDGHIQRKPTHPDARNPQLRPILMAYRSMNPKFRAYEVEQFTIAGGTAMIRGRPCVELQRRTQAHQGAFVIRCWVDPKRDYLIVREMMVENDQVGVQIDIDFAPHAVAGWQPTSWKVIANYRGTNKMRGNTSAS